MLRRARSRSGFSQARLGQIVGRSPSTIRRWEKGHGLPKDPEIVVSLAAVLNIPEDDLLQAAGLELDFPALSGSVALDDLASDIGELDVLEVTSPATASSEHPDESVEDGVSMLSSQESVDDEPASEETRPQDGSGAVDVQADTALPAEPGAVEESETEPVEASVAGDVVATEPESTFDGVRPSETPTPPPVPQEAEDGSANRHEAMNIGGAARSGRSVAAPPTVLVPTPQAPKSYLEDAHEMWTYRIRAVLVVVVGILLLLLLEWGLRQLGASLRAIKG